MHGLFFSGRAGWRVGYFGWLAVVSITVDGIGCTDDGA